MSTQTATAPSAPVAGEAGEAGPAVAAAVAGLDEPPSLVVAFTAGQGGTPDELAAEIAVAAGDAPTVGLSGAGLIGPEGAREEGCVALALDSGMCVSTARVEAASADLRAAGRTVAREALETNHGEPDLMLLIVDSSKGDVAETISGAYEYAGPTVKLAGGAAGGAHRCQFIDGEAITDSVIAVAIASPRRVGVGLAQSCRVGSSPSLVTRSDERTVQEINGRSAEQAYADAIGVDPGSLTDEEFAYLAVAHPLAQLELHGDPRLRHVIGRDGEGGLLMGSHIPASTPIEFVELEQDQLEASARKSVGSALDLLGEEFPRAALIFDCAGRRRVMRDGPEGEVEVIKDALGGSVPAIAGTYTNGEIARLRGAVGDRNHAVVTVAFA